MQGRVTIELSHDGPAHKKIRGVEFLEKIVPVIEIVETAKKAMLEVGVEPKIFPVRGGTDGSKLSFMGLPTPNIFTGAHNYHGRFEYVPVQTMEKAVEVIVKIIELFGLK